MVQMSMLKMFKDAHSIWQLNMGTKNTALILMSNNADVNAINYNKLTPLQLKC